MKAIVKSLDRPDDTPKLPGGVAQLVNMGEALVVRGVLEPGWRWSNDWQPMFGTPSCQMPHLGVVLSGQIRFEMDDGTTLDAGPGDVYSIPPGHDAWVVGDSPVETLDFAPVHDEATERAIAIAAKT